MSATGSVLLLVAFLLGQPDGPDEDDAPVRFQAVPHFSNAVAGRGFAIAWSAQPTELPTDADLTLTLTITGAANPHRVRRPDLAALPAFKSLFRTITAGNDPPAARDAKAVTFTYRLRPADARVQAVPELAFAYYSPGADRLTTKYLDKIPLKLTAATVPPPPALPLDEPERFFRLPSDAELRAGPPPAPDWRHWLGLAAVLTVGTAVAVVAWRMLNPGGLRLVRMRRNRVVRTALDALDAAPRSPDPAAAAAHALRNYLVERHGLPAATAGPLAVEASLATTALPAEKVVTAAEVLRKFDAVRFGGSGDNAVSLVAQARELVLRWEDGG